MMRNQLLYRRLLGDAFDRLPEKIRTMHETGMRCVSEGTCEVRGGTNMLARLMARIFSFPQEGSKVPIRVTFTRHVDQEIWVREFGDQRLRTTQRLETENGRSLLVERFGIVDVHMAAVVDDAGDMTFLPRRMSVFGLSLPNFLIPKVAAKESFRNGRFAFDARADLPLLGTLIHYRGELAQIHETSVENDKEATQIYEQDGPIMLFDGVCNLCCGGVRFFMERDPDARIRYCAMQSEAGQKLLRKFGLPLTDYETFVVLEGERLLFESAAFFALIRHLQFPWSSFQIAQLVPRVMRDWLYGLVARNRYRLSGQREVCFVPSEELASRFI